MQFNNRIQAGRELIKRMDLSQFDNENIEIVAIPNEGIMVAIPLAESLEKKIKVLISSIIVTAPPQSIAFGAILRLRL